jgi:hypothetical protein
VTAFTTDETAPRLLDEHQRSTARFIAGLIDGEVDRRTPISRRDWVACHLGVAGNELIELRQTMTGFEQIVQLTALGQLLRVHPPTAIGGTELPSPPVLAPPVRPDLPELPEEVTAAWVHLEPLGCPVGISIEPDYRDVYAISWFVPNGSLEVFHRALPAVVRHLEEAVAGELRGGSYRVVKDPQPALEALETSTIVRSELVLPDEVWQLLDDDLHRLFHTE